VDDITHICLRLTEVFLGFSLLVQTSEFLNLRQALGPDGTFAYRIQRQDLSHIGPHGRWLFDLMANETVYFLHLLARLAAAISLIIFGSSLGVMVFLFVGTILILIRWRGAFNGGSDFMTIVVLTGLLVSALYSSFGDASTGASTGARTGLFYIAIHSATSYFISGWVKLLSADWRSGRALVWFLDDSVFGPLPQTSRLRLPAIALTGSWAFILWEASIPLALLNVWLMAVFCLIGLIFHFLVYWYLGLNRFLAAWIASYPALIFTALQLTA